jgi:DNA-binding transcriptional ArsR family regulator
VNALQLIAEPRRQEILWLVWHDEMPVGVIAERLDLSYGGVSQHLALLRDAGLVRVRRDGKRRLYVADHHRLGPLAPILEAFWEERVARLAQLAEEADPT